MALDHVKRNWEALARRDPMWAILTDSDKRGGRWSAPEFFAVGEQEIDAVMARAAELGLPTARARALDFGCGVGRIAQALCRHFERCDGVDIAPTMISEARRLNRHGERCAYHQDHGPDLRLFPDPTFDLVYTNMVLQHLPPSAARGYVGELARVLRPGGLLVFQVPERMRMPRAIWRPLARVAARVVARLRRTPLMEMYGLPPAAVRVELARADARLVLEEEDGAAGPAWVGWRYWATRG